MGRAVARADGSDGGTLYPTSESSPRKGGPGAARRDCTLGSTAGAPNGVGRAAVMFFFSNRLGCGGSILVSLVGTLVLLLLFGVIDL